MSQIGLSTFTSFRHTYLIWQDGIFLSYCTRMKLDLKNGTSRKASSDLTNKFHVIIFLKRRFSFMFRCFWQSNQGASASPAPN